MDRLSVVESSCEISLVTYSRIVFRFGRVAVSTTSDTMVSKAAARYVERASCSALRIAFFSCWVFIVNPSGNSTLTESENVTRENLQKCQAYAIVHFQAHLTLKYTAVKASTTKAPKSNNWLQSFGETVAAPSKRRIMSVESQNTGCLVLVESVDIVLKVVVVVVRGSTRQLSESPKLATPVPETLRPLHVKVDEP